MILPTSGFFCNIVLAILDPLYFRQNLTECNKSCWPVASTALDLWINLERIVILTMLCLLVHGHCMRLPLFRSPSMYFIRILWVYHPQPVHVWLDLYIEYYSFRLLWKTFYIKVVVSNSISLIYRMVIYCCVDFLFCDLTKLMY